MCLYVDLDLSRNKSELTVYHSNEVFDIVLVHFLVMNYDFSLIARRSSAYYNTQAYIWTVRWFCVMGFLSMCMEEVRFSSFYIILSSGYKSTNEFFSSWLFVSKFQSRLEILPLLWSWWYLWVLCWSPLFGILLHHIGESALRSRDPNSCATLILLFFYCWKVLFF